MNTLNSALKPPVTYFTAEATSSLMTGHELESDSMRCMDTCMDAKKYFTGRRHVALQKTQKQEYRTHAAVHRIKKKLDGIETVEPYHNGTRRNITLPE